jgi:hypothetical protein
MANHYGHSNHLAPRPQKVYELMNSAALVEIDFFSGMDGISGRGRSNYLMSVVEQMYLEMLSGYLANTVESHLAIGR